MHSHFAVKERHFDFANLVKYANKQYDTHLQKSGNADRQTVNCQLQANDRSDSVDVPHYVLTTPSKELHTHFKAFFENKGVSFTEQDNQLTIKTDDLTARQLTYADEQHCLFTLNQTLKGQNVKEETVRSASMRLK